MDKNYKKSNKTFLCWCCCSCLSCARATWGKGKDMCGFECESIGPFLESDDSIIVRGGGFKAVRPNYTWLWKPWLACRGCRLRSGISHSSFQRVPNTSASAHCQDFLVPCLSSWRRRKGWRSGWGQKGAYFVVLYKTQLFATIQEAFITAM